MKKKTIHRDVIRMELSLMKEIPTELFVSEFCKINDIDVETMSKNKFTNKEGQRNVLSNVPCLKGSIAYNKSIHSAMCKALLYFMLHERYEISYEKLRDVLAPIKRQSIQYHSDLARNLISVKDEKMNRLYIRTLTHFCHI